MHKWHCARLSCGSGECFQMNYNKSRPPVCQPRSPAGSPLTVEDRLLLQWTPLYRIFIFAILEVVYFKSMSGGVGKIRWKRRRWVQYTRFGRVDADYVLSEARVANELFLCKSSAFLTRRLPRTSSTGCICLLAIECWWLQRLGYRGAGALSWRGTYCACSSATPGFCQETTDRQWYCHWMHGQQEQPQLEQVASSTSSC